MSAAPLAVLGLGGVGGMIAARTGAICVGTERTVAAIRANGVTLRHEGKTIAARPGAVERLEHPVALLVVAVKAYRLDEALDRVAPSSLEGALALPLLNGLEQVEAVRGRLEGLCVVAAGSIGRVEAVSTAPGVVAQRTGGDAVITAACRDLPRNVLDDRLAPLRVPGLEVVLAADERGVLWEKAARLAVLAAATVASGERVGALRRDTAWRRRLSAALGEACGVATADGVPLEPAGQWAIIDAMPHDLTTSTARDAAAGHPTELDAITGSVVRAGRRLGVETSTLEGLLEAAYARAGSPA